MVTTGIKANQEEEEAAAALHFQDEDSQQKGRRNFLAMVSLSLVLILFLNSKPFFSLRSSQAPKAFKGKGRNIQAFTSTDTSSKNIIHVTNTTLFCPTCYSASESNATVQQERALQSFQPTQVTFYVTGDAPYDGSQAIRLEAYMERVPESAAFLVHVGDMRYAGNYDVCGRYNEYTHVRQIMLKSRAPVFMLIGDNDIADCPNPDEGQEHWIRNLDRLWDIYRFPQRVRNLEGIPGTWTFTMSNILFIGLHTTDVPNSFARQQGSWARSLINNYKRQLSPRVGRVVIFCHSAPYAGYNHAHRVLFDLLSESFGNEQLPFLFVQGDTHIWEVERNFYGNPSWLRIYVEGEAHEAPTRMTIQSNGNYQDPLQAFHFQRQRRQG